MTSRERKYHHKKIKPAYGYREFIMDAPTVSLEQLFAEAKKIDDASAWQKFPPMYVSLEYKQKFEEAIKALPNGTNQRVSKESALEK